MTLYEPSSSPFQRLRSIFQKRINDGTLAVLGDANGRTEVPDRIGFVYCRLPDGRDSNGFALYSAPFMVRSSGAAFQNYAGAQVWIATGYDGQLEIKSAHYPGLDQAGIDTRTLNPLHQQSKWVYPWQLTMGLVKAVATAATTSTRVMVKSFRFYSANTFQVASTPLLADKPDLAAYIPDTDEHCYAALWLDTYLNEFVVTTSVVQSLFTPLDATDVNELVTDRPPDAMPLAAIYLSNDQATITQSILDVDLRQFLGLPVLWGFPRVVNFYERIQPLRQALINEQLTINKQLIIEDTGQMVIL